ncbi:MAG: LysM peptidoglycan-binding domain-containing protein [Solirubrobacterales bacterium]
MPDYKPSQVARAFAVLALVAALIVVVVVVATSGGGSDGGGNGGAQVKSKGGPSKRGRAAVSRGVWIVHPGDTLGKISEETGVDIDILIQLNPDLDPQALLEGQRIALR